MEGSSPATKAADFTDNLPGQYYPDALAWGAEQGIITGYDDGRYGPSNPITREQIAAILWRYARFKKYDVSIGESTNILSFLDYQQISGYAVPALQWAVGEGIISGMGQYPRFQWPRHPRPDRSYAGAVFNGRTVKSI